MDEEQFRRRADELGRLRHELNTDIWHASFNEEQVVRLSRYQMDDQSHPYTLVEVQSYRFVSWD